MRQIPDWMKDGEAIKVISTSQLRTQHYLDGWVSRCGLITLADDGCKFSEFYRWELPEHKHGTPKGVDLFAFRTERGRHVSVERYETWEEAAWALNAIFEAALNGSSPKVLSTEELLEATSEMLWDELNAIGTFGEPFRGTQPNPPKVVPRNPETNPEPHTTSNPNLEVGHNSLG